MPDVAERDEDQLLWLGGSAVYQLGQQLVLS